MNSFLSKIALSAKVESGKILSLPSFHILIKTELSVCDLSIPKVSPCSAGYFSWTAVDNTARGDSF